MFYDTTYRHHQALHPSGLEAFPAALHALITAADDCRRAGKPIAQDAAILLLSRNLASVIRPMAGPDEALRLRCVIDRASIEASPALLEIAGHHVGGDPAAKRAFHAQARRAVAQLAAEIGLGAGEARVQTIDGDDDDDGVTELRHPDIGIRVVPRSFLPDSEITFHRCRGGEPSSRVFRAPIAELLDAPAFARRLALSIGALPPSLEAAA